MFGARFISTLPVAVVTIALLLSAAPSSAGGVSGEIDADDSWAYSTPWYHQPPLQGTGPGLYYSYYPEHVPGYPEELRGYPVPIYSTSRPIAHAPAVRYRSISATHVAWCHDRWLSYRASDNTYQPSYGPRRQCRSRYF